MSERGRKKPTRRKRQGITPPMAPRKRIARKMAEARDEIQRKQHRETLKRVRHLMQGGEDENTE